MTRGKQRLHYICFVSLWSGMISNFSFGAKGAAPPTLKPPYCHLSVFKYAPSNHLRVPGFYFNALQSTVSINLTSPIFGRQAFTSDYRLYLWISLFSTYRIVASPFKCLGFIPVKQHNSLQIYQNRSRKIRCLTFHTRKVTRSRQPLIVYMFRSTCVRRGLRQGQV